MKKWIEILWEQNDELSNNTIIIQKYFNYVSGLIHAE